MSKSPERPMASVVEVLVLPSSQSPCEAGEQ